MQSINFNKLRVVKMEFKCPANMVRVNCEHICWFGVIPHAFMFPSATPILNASHDGRMYHYMFLTSGFSFLTGPWWDSIYRDRINVARSLKITLD